VSEPGAPHVVPVPDNALGLNVLVTGGSGPSGIAVARALHRAGFRVFTVGSDSTRIEEE